MTARVRFIILVLAVAGLAFAGASTWVHYRLLTDPTYYSPCDINATFNCSSAYLSRYGSVAGVPVAVGGLIWFALVALIAGFARPRPGDRTDPAGAYLFALSTVALAAVLYLAYASFAVLRTGCVLCIGTYVAVAGIFIASGLAPSAPLASLPGRLLADLRGLTRRPATLAASLLFVAGTAAALVSFPGEPGSAAAARPAPSPAPPAAAGAATPASGEAAFAEAWAAQPRVDLGIPLDGARVLVVKFNDYECPACRLTWEMYKPVLEKYAATSPGAVRVISKDYPLSNRCNFQMSTDLHPGACAAAAAVRIARDHGKADEMEAWLFANQTGLRPDAIAAAVATVTGITDFDRQYALKLPGIRRDIADGGALGIDSTPTFFINGVRLPTGRLTPPEYFDLAIRLELERAGR